MLKRRKLFLLYKQDMFSDRWFLVYQSQFSETINEMALRIRSYSPNNALKIRVVS